MKNYLKLWTNLFSGVKEANVQISINKPEELDNEANSNMKVLKARGDYLQPDPRVQFSHLVGTKEEMDQMVDFASEYLEKDMIEKFKNGELGKSGEIGLPEPVAERIRGLFRNTHYAIVNKRYSHPPFVASPYCSTGYLTAKRSPVEIISHLDPSVIVDYPSQLMPSVLGSENSSLTDIHTRLRNRGLEAEYKLRERIRNLEKNCSFKVLTHETKLSYQEPDVVNQIKELLAMGVPGQAIDMFLLKAFSGMFNNKISRSDSFDKLVKDIKERGGNWLDEFGTPHPDTKIYSSKLKFYLQIATYQHCLLTQGKLNSFNTVQGHEEQLKQFMIEYERRVTDVIGTTSVRPYLVYKNLGHLVEILLFEGELVCPILPWHYEPIADIYFG